MGRRIADEVRKKARSRIRIQFNRDFDVRSAIGIRDLVRGFPRSAIIVLDFARVRRFGRLTLSALVPALATLKGVNVFSDGLSRYPQAFLERLGIAPLDRYGLVPAHARLAT